MGRDDARELAVALIAAYEGIALLAATLRDPGLISTEGDRLERWIDSLAELALFAPIATQEGTPMTPQSPRTVDLFVNGRWQPPRTGQYEPATSPVTGELIGQVAQAVAGTLVGAYLCAGQSCTAAERILVHERVHDAFTEALAAAVGKEVVLGDPFDPRTTMGPLNNADVAAKTARHVADALGRGAELVAGGGAGPGLPTALYRQPTVLDNVPRDAVVAREETFGRSPRSSRSPRLRTRSR